MADLNAPRLAPTFERLGATATDITTDHVPPGHQGAAVPTPRSRWPFARLHPDDVAAYYDVKDPICDLVMDAAERWATDVAWSP